MSLSPKAFSSLADTLAPEVINYIEEDPRYFDFLMEIVPDAIEEKMGKMEFDLYHELCMAISERIVMKTYKQL